MRFYPTNTRVTGTFGLLLSITFLLSMSNNSLADNETRFTVVSSSTSSWVARGYHDYTVGPDNGWTVSVGRNYHNGIHLRFSGQPIPGTTVDYWDLNFAAPSYDLITPGYYPNFQRFPFQDSNRPGLGFSSTGRCDNQASGTFEVFEATYGPEGEVLTFSADFTHFGERNPNNWAIVEVRYNVPEPTSVVLLLAGSAATCMRRRIGLSQ